MVLHYGRNTTEDSIMRQVVFAATGLLLGEDKDNHQAVLDACQVKDIYRDLIEWSEVECWPEELAEFDDVFGLKALRPWL
jgi:hypothetical protein